MQCPKCVHVSLKPAVVKDTEVDQCSECHGVWFDEMELSRLLATTPGELKPLARGRLDPVDDRRSGRCPRDDEPLMRVRSTRERSVVVEVCPRCRGIWLDGGELARLLQA